MAPLRSEVGVPVKKLVKNVAWKKKSGLQNNVIATIYKILSVKETEFTDKDGTNTCLTVRMTDYTTVWAQYRLCEGIHF